MNEEIGEKKIEVNDKKQLVPIVCGRQCDDNRKKKHIHTRTSDQNSKCIHCKNNHWTTYRQTKRLLTIARYLLLCTDVDIRPHQLWRHIPHITLFPFANSRIIYRQIFMVVHDQHIMIVMIMEMCAAIDFKYPKIVIKFADEMIDTHDTHDKHTSTKYSRHKRKV